MKDDDDFGFWQYAFTGFALVVVAIVFVLMIPFMVVGWACCRVFLPKDVD